MKHYLSNFLDDQIRKLRTKGIFGDNDYIFKGYKPN